MSEVYRVRYRLGKTEIEVESSDRSYVDTKLAELIETFAGKKGKTKAKAKTAKPKTAKPKTAKPKTAKPKTAKKAAKPKAKAKRKPAAKSKAAAKAKSKPTASAAKKAKAKAVTPDDLAGQIKTHAAFTQINSSILTKPGQLPRVLLCHYFANKLGIAQGLTAHQVESITNELGVRIASPNVAKVIRQKGKKFFSSDRKDGVTIYKINNSGLTAVEQIVST